MSGTIHSLAWLKAGNTRCPCQCLQYNTPRIFQPPSSFFPDASAFSLPWIRELWADVLPAPSPTEIALCWRLASKE